MGQPSHTRAHPLTESQVSPLWQCGGQGFESPRLHFDLACEPVTVNRGAGGAECLPGTATAEGLCASRITVSAQWLSSSRQAHAYRRSSVASCRWKAVGDRRANSRKSAQRFVLDRDRSRFHVDPDRQDRLDPGELPVPQTGGGPREQRAEHENQRRVVHRRDSTGRVRVAKSRKCQKLETDTASSMCETVYRPRPHRSPLPRLTTTWQ
jgi:hypothetical protein